MLYEFDICALLRRRGFEQRLGVGHRDGVAGHHQLRVEVSSNM